MRRLTVFNHVSMEGYFTDASGDMSWAHAGSDDAEFAAFTAENAKGGGVLVFGRRTYDMMAGFWPTPAAAQSLPTVAAQMNALEKIVFSRSLDKATWNNTRLIKSDLLTEMREIKDESGPELVIMGSGTIVAQLAQAGLIDTFQVVINPIVLGKGRTMFEGLDRPLNLTLVDSRTFRNGKIFATYVPQGRS